MKAILYDILLIFFGMILILFRNFYGSLGQKGAKTDEGRAQLTQSRMYQAKVWNALIVGAAFVLFGAYLLYLNLMKAGN